MGAENSILEDCQWNDVVSTSSGDDWSLRQATLKDETTVSVFQHKKKDRNTVDLLKRGAKNLRTLRHPSLLRFIASGESSDGSYLVTEQVQPLSNCLATLHSLEICAGLQSILDALLFLHDMVGVTHNNVCLSSVFVTADGAWKLGGLEHSCKFSEATADFLDKCLAYRNEDTVTPEEKQGNLSTSPEFGHTRDVFSFGVMAEQLLERLEELGDLTKTFELRVQDECLHADPTQRPHIQSLLNDRLFRHDFLEVLRFVKNIPTKSEEEKEEFFRTVTDKLLSLPEELVAKCLAVPLLSRFVMLDNTANKYMIPSLLTPFKETKRPKVSQGGQPIPLLPADLFKENIIPELFRIFHIRDAHIRKVLLRHFPGYADLFDRDTLEDVIFPQLLLGLRDIDDQIVAASLRSLSYLVPILGGDIVIGGTRKKFFSEGMPKMCEFGNRSRQEEKKSKMNVSGIMGKKMLLKDLAALSNTGNSSALDENDKDAKWKERERRREEARQRREERKKKRQEQQKNENNKAADLEDSQEITVISDGETQETDIVENTNGTEMCSLEKDDLTEKADWSDWEAENHDDQTPTVSDDESFNEDKFEDEIENELKSMPSTVSPRVTEPTPFVDWSDPPREDYVVDKHKTKGALKLGQKSKEKSKDKSQPVTVSETSEESVFQVKPEVSEWSDSWDDIEQNLNTSSKSIGNKTVIKTSIPKPMTDLGEEFDIKVKPVNKSAPAELDFFSDMMPDINVTVEDPLSSWTNGHQDNGGSPKKERGKALSFAVVEAEETNQGDGEGWGDDLEWGTEDF